MNKAPDTPLSMEPGHPDDGADLHIALGAVKAALPPSLASRVDQMFPKLAPAEIDRLRRFGTVKTWQPGELLFEAGKPGPGMFVLLRGRVAVTRKNALGVEAPIVEHTPGQFMAEVGQLSGRPALVDGRALDVVEALLIDPPSLRALVIAEAELGERIMRAPDSAARGIDRNRRGRPGIDRHAPAPRTWCGCRDFCRGTAIRTRCWIPRWITPQKR